MESPSNSDISPQTSIYWGSDSDSESLEPATTSLYQNPPSDPPRPRLSSPRLFQNFFSGASRANARLPPAPAAAFPTRLQDFPRAFDPVNRAVQTAHQAFQGSPVVDLTISSPQQPISPRSLTPRSTTPRSNHSRSVSEDSLSDDLSPRPHIHPHCPDMSPHTGRSRPSHGLSFTTEPASKRRKISRRYDRGHAERDSGIPVQGEYDGVREIESVDLTEVNNSVGLQQALAKQRQDAIRAQMMRDEGGKSVGRTTLSSYKCPICMDTPEDATTTSCGHLFCHKCIIDTLRWSEQQHADEYTNGKPKGTCPVCRKPLARNDKPGNGRTLIPLELKLMSRKQTDVKGKGVAREGTGMLSKGVKRPKSEREKSSEMWNDFTVLGNE